MQDTMTAIYTRARALLRGFAASRRGNVAMMFGLALVPLMIAVGAGLDYARAALVKSQIADALDAAALAVGSSGLKSQDDVQKAAQAYFNANYKGPGTVTVVIKNYDAKGGVTLGASADVSTSLLKVVDMPTIGVGTSSTVVWGQNKLWVAMVLDNSGSMSQSDKNGSKMDALKVGAKSMLGSLQKTAAASNAGDVLVAIAPFTKNVNMGTANRAATWLDWSDWNTTPPSSVTPDSSHGPGDNCPYSYGCVTPTSSTGALKSTSTIPSSGTYTGYICPGPSSSNSSGMEGHYYAGCYTSTDAKKTTTVSTGRNASCNGYSSKNCSCTGSNSKKVCDTKTWTHKWTIASQNMWQGCVMDRDNTKDYDVLNTTPGTGSGFPAENNSSCPDAAVTKLNNDWTSLTDQINGMVASGSTNQPIGLAHGWELMTPGTPYGVADVPSGTTRYIILFSDGLNTQDRWYGNGSTEGTDDDKEIDKRMDKICTNAKTDGVVIYTVFVHLGTSDPSVPLRNCASDLTKYYDVTSTTGIGDAFNDIAQKITSLRVAE